MIHTMYLKVAGKVEALNVVSHFGGFGETMLIRLTPTVSL